MATEKNVETVLPPAEPSKEIGSSLETSIQDTSKVHPQSVQTSHDELEDVTVYPTAIPLLLITIALALAIFLTALVCLLLLHKTKFVV